MLGHDPRPKTHERILEVCRMLASGMTSAAIIEYLKDKYDIGKTHSEEYLKRARKVLKQNATINHEAELKRHLAARRLIVFESLQCGDRRTAVQCLDSEAKLLGLFEKHNSGGETINADELQNEFESETEETIEERIISEDIDEEQE